MIFVVVKKLTKYAHFMSLTHPYTTKNVAKTFLDNVFKLHGLPESITSDRDIVFISTFWQDLFKLQGVSLNMSITYHPQSDGQTEVVNNNLKTYLRCVCGDMPHLWVQWHSLAEFWYNTFYHSTIHMSPFHALYGVLPPVHIPYFPKDSNVAAVDIFMRDRESTITLLQHYLKRTAMRMKQAADKHRSERKFEIGDMVYLKLML